ncbi:protein of unknown function [Bacteroides ovatus]|jgi:hypothetical protein|uniref:Uncharacterized protein n=2 Tax=Bacteroides ovatus TaxID=28116 RepID=A0A1G8FXS8_BACOV|nr:protein of unknown function [Bacteroides ovatus]
MACLLLASAAFTACDEDFKDWADPQSNPQEEAITAMVDITPVTSMKLEEQPGDSVVIASVSSIAENFSLTACNIELVAEGQTLNLPSRVKNGGVKVRLTELDQKVASLYKSQKSVEREVTLKLTPMVTTTNGEATSLTDYPEMKSVFTPVATPAVDTEYYMVGGLNGWQMDKATATKFEADQDNQYLFSVVVEPEEKFDFKIVPGSAIEAPDAWQRALGASKVIEDPDPGLLAFRDKEGTDPDNLTCTGGKKMKITINVEDYTYTIKEDLPEHMYINGSPYSAGWDWAVAPEMVPVTQTPGMFWSIQYYTAGDQIKFAPARNWEGGFGYNEDFLSPETIEFAGLTLSGTDNISIGKSGWYLVVVTVTAEGKTISFRLPEVYLLGGVINNSWNCDGTTLFTIPIDRTSDFISPAATVAGMARICTTAVDAGGWWKSEFTLDLANGGGGTIVYRENKIVSDNLSELGYECNVTAGQKVHINFTAGKGKVE